MGEWIEGKEGKGGEGRGGEERGGEKGKMKGKKEYIYIKFIIHSFQAAHGTSGEAASSPRQGDVDEGFTE